MVVAAPPPFVQALHMVDARVGYLVGGRQTATTAQLYRTADGARTWRIVLAGNVAAPPTTVGRALVYVPVRIGGAIVVERSSDGGATWKAARPIRDRRPAGPGQVVRVDARHLYLPLGEGAAAGSSAQSLWRSDDGGDTWRFVSRTTTATRRRGALPFSCDKNGVGFVTAARGWAGGACAGGPAFLYRTSDGGSTWRPQALSGLSRCACDVSPPAFANAQDGAFAVTGFPQAGGSPAVSRVYWTSDGGAHWRLTRPPAGRIGIAQFVGGRTAWIAGTAQGSIRVPFDRLFRTIDAGRHWQVTRLPFDGTIDPVGDRLAFALTEHALLRTSDGGRTWHRIRRYP